MQTFEYTDINLYDKEHKDFCDGLEHCKTNEGKTQFLDGLFNYLKRLKLDKALVRGHRQISTKNFVGVIKYKKFQLDILPKLLKKSEGDDYYKTILPNLMFMLSYVKKLDIKTTSTGKISESKNPFLEILIREYAQSLFNCLKRLTPKKYIKEEDNLNYLKGKLKFNEQIKFNCANKAKFYCEYDEFSENNILNQLFVYVSTCLYNVSKDGKNKKILKQIIDYFCDIKLVKFDKYKVQKIRLSKTQQMFEKPFNLAKMFVENSSVDISKNKINNITLLWDMNILFEEFIFQCLKRHTGLDPHYQKGRALLIETEGRHKYGRTFVDMYIEKDGKKIILDTKYKLNSGKNNDFENTDVYQVMTYCLIHKSNKAVLIYPIEGVNGVNGVNVSENGASEIASSTKYFLNTDYADKNKAELCENFEKDYDDAPKIISIKLDLKKELNSSTAKEIAKGIEKILFPETSSKVISNKSI